MDDNINFKPKSGLDRDLRDKVQKGEINILEIVSNFKQQIKNKPNQVQKKLKENETDKVNDKESLQDLSETLEDVYKNTEKSAKLHDTEIPSESIRKPRLHRDDILKELRERQLNKKKNSKFKPIGKANVSESKEVPLLQKKNNQVVKKVNKPKEKDSNKEKLKKNIENIDSQNITNNNNNNNHSETTSTNSQNINETQDDESDVDIFSDVSSEYNLNTEEAEINQIDSIKDKNENKNEDKNTKQGKKNYFHTNIDKEKTDQNDSNDSKDLVTTVLLNKIDSLKKSSGDNLSFDESIDELSNYDGYDIDETDDYGTWESDNSDGPSSRKKRRRRRKPIKE